MGNVISGQDDLNFTPLLDTPGWALSHSPEGGGMRVSPDRPNRPDAPLQWRDAILEPFNTASDEEAQAVVDILYHPEMQHRFASPPESIETLREIARNPRLHIFVLKKGDLIIGTTTINDARESDHPEHYEHEHFGRYTGIHPEHQRHGYGGALLGMRNYLAFSGLTYDGNPRRKIFAGVTKTPGFEAIITLLKRLGYEQRQELVDQVGGGVSGINAVDAFYQSAGFPLFNTVRLELSALTWVRTVAAGQDPLFQESKSGSPGVNEKHYRYIVDFLHPAIEAAFARNANHTHSAQADLGQDLAFTG